MSWNLTVVLAVTALSLPLKCPKSSGSGASGAGAGVSSAIWISQERIASRPTSGAAWDSLWAQAQEWTGQPDLSDQNDPTNTRTLAKALVYARTGEASYRQQVIEACDAVIGTEAGGNTLAVGRNLASFVLAANLVGLPAGNDARFSAWLRSMLNRNLAGRTLVSTHQDRPNNWGTHAGATRAAIAAYLGDDAELDRTATIFRGWLGDRGAYANFEYSGSSWHPDPKRPVGVNPTGSEIDGFSVDGVLPDDQRRSGRFQWPPPAENYVYEALQGALLQAMILERAGYDPWSWSDAALLRAFEWLHDEANYPASGDDAWQPHLINHVYGVGFPAMSPAAPGKNVGYLDWTHGAN